MPPKASTVDITDASFKFIFSVLKHCEEIKPNWEEVAKENGITYARNAAGRFRDVVRRLGFRFENGRMLSIDDGGEAVPATPTPKAAKTPKAKKTLNGMKSPAVVGKKRKIAEVEDNDEEATDDQHSTVTGSDTVIGDQEE